MKAQVGLWIDHKKAIVVNLTDKGEEISLIKSKAEKQLRRYGDSPLKGPHELYQVQADDIKQRILSEHLNIYYNEVIASIRNANSVLIFGPGDAKEELKKRLKKNSLGEKISAIETVDRMTNNQIAAKVRKYFRKDLSNPENTINHQIHGTRGNKKENKMIENSR